MKTRKHKQKWTPERSMVMRLIKALAIAGSGIMEVFMILVAIGTRSLLWGPMIFFFLGPLAAGLVYWILLLPAMVYAWIRGDWRETSSV